MLTALVTGLVAAVATAAINNSLPGFRDTDDATRLEMVRELLAGRGWYDQLLTRIDPPHGLWMHWSRLLDGGVASMMAAFRLFMAPAAAEYWTRYLWPLLWILPGVAAGLAIARNLGARSATAIAAVLLAVDSPLYRQFYPGRIDHHDVQIVMTVIVMACATARVDRARWAAVAGLAAAFGLAVGLEALPMQALAGASFGLALARDRGEAPVARNYGLALGLGGLAFYLIQTPPMRWSLSFCDALALNSTAALVTAGLGLALTAFATPRVPAWLRLGLLAGVGLASAAVYLGLDPNCLHGPFADVDPEVKRIWLTRVQEVQPLPVMFARSRGPAIGAYAMSAMGLAAAGWLVWRTRRTLETGPLLILAEMVLAVAVGWSAWRMQDYVCWTAVPALAAAYSWVARRWLRELLLPTIVGTLVFSPVALAVAVRPPIDAAVVALAKHAAAAPPKASPAAGAPHVNVTSISPAPPAPSRRILVANAKLPILPHLQPSAPDKSPRCFAAATWAPLAALPPGNVLDYPDFGPFILVYTRDTAVAAPYHRVWPAILAVNRVFSSPPATAEAQVRRLGADYVVDCPPYGIPTNQGGLGAALRTGNTPPWLRLVSRPGARLHIYKVLPALRPPG
ncbi:MAG: hypothetical protein ABSD80_12030 [Caulobacteraceae bacterium]